jgi:hypothetical protein
VDLWKITFLVCPHEILYPRLEVLPNSFLFTCHVAAQALP